MEGEQDLAAEHIRLDFGRRARRGYAEAILCEPKSVDQVRTIAALIREKGEPTIFTRVTLEQWAVIEEELPDAAFYSDARFAAWPEEPPSPTGGLVVVVAAGTSDLPVAKEAVLTASYLGCRVELVVDVGVAGLHRILQQQELLSRAKSIVVAAGMDGALASVVAGLVSAPVVALPTSVGYGAAFGGIAPLLSMLNACAPGVGVVNIDNGYGAGHLAAQIAGAHLSNQR